MYITNFIPKGKENAVTREHLCWVTDQGDRKVRNDIEDARRDGALIINLNGHKGYWISEDPAEIERYIKQEESRLKSIGARLKAPRRFLKSETAETVRAVTTAKEKYTNSLYE